MDFVETQDNATSKSGERELHVQWNIDTILSLWSQLCTVLCRTVIHLSSEIGGGSELV